MKVAVLEFAGKGGLIHYAYQLCRAMAQEGADVTLITDRHYELEQLPHPFKLDRILDLWDPKPQNDKSGALRKRVRRVARGAQYYREWARALRRVRELAPDVVQLGDIRFATDLLAVAAMRRRAPVLADICHNVRPFAGGEGSNGMFSASRHERALYRRIYRQFDSVFVHYDVNIREFARTFPHSAEKVIRIVHANEEIFRELADPEVTRDSLRRELALPERARVVLFFGTLSHYKGVDLLLDAFRDVAVADRDAVLVVAGFPHSDFDVAGFRARAEALQVSDRVRLHPHYVDSSAVKGWMELADLIVFPYRDVFQSGALHVAQTFGVPIVATAVGAMPEVIRSGDSGIIVPPNDRFALAGAIAGLLSDGEKSRAFARAAAHDAETTYSWRGVARTILAEYEAQLSRRRGVA